MAVQVDCGSDGFVTEAEGLFDVAYTTIGSPMGTLLLAATARGLVRVAFDVEDHDRVLEMLAKRISPRVLRAPEAAGAAAIEGAVLPAEPPSGAGTGA
jgi:hypothetical protein